MLDHVVERVLDPGLKRHNAFLRRLQAQGLARRAVDLADEGRGGHGERVADDAREPLVVHILERRLAGFDQLKSADMNLVMRRRARLPLISASK
jgi:hypothetical protein